MTANLFPRSVILTWPVCVEPDELYRVIDKSKVGDLIKFVLGYDCSRRGAITAAFISVPLPVCSISCSLHRHIGSKAHSRMKANQ